jgi:hypothetical protein
MVWDCLIVGLLWLHHIRSLADVTMATIAIGKVGKLIFPRTSCYTRRRENLKPCPLNLTLTYISDSRVLTFSSPWAWCPINLVRSLPNHMHATAFHPHDPNIEQKSIDGSIHFSYCDNAHKATNKALLETNSARKTYRATFRLNAFPCLKRCGSQKNNRWLLDGVKPEDSSHFPVGTGSAHSNIGNFLLLGCDAV